MANLTCPTLSLLATLVVELALCSHTVDWQLEFHSARYQMDTIAELEPVLARASRLVNVHGPPKRWLAVRFHGLFSLTHFFSLADGSGLTLAYVFTDISEGSE